MNASNMVAQAMIEKEKENQVIQDQLHESEKKITELEESIKEYEQNIMYKDQEIACYKI
jgi:septal ring factor EnvC (AmiA/AmiB activator)